MIILLIIAPIIFCFFVAILFGAPYLPTLKAQVRAALELADLKPGQTLLELGCGDGRVLLAAAKKGVNSVGIELNPFLAFIAWLRSLRYRRYIKVIWGNYWILTWPKADAIFVFLLDRYMSKLDKKCVQYPFTPVKLISFAFKVPGKKEKSFSRGVYLYEYK